MSSRVTAATAEEAHSLVGDHLPSNSQSLLPKPVGLSGVTSPTSLSLMALATGVSVIMTGADVSTASADAPSSHRGASDPTGRSSAEPSPAEREGTGKHEEGVEIWAPDSDAMEAIGAALQQHGLVQPGMVVLLNGQLGSGKTTVSRGFIRSFCQNPFLDVPSPTYLLCLSYAQDLAHDHAARSSNEHVPRIHHMDPYRLGKNVDKMAGLIDFESALKEDICLIEWPDRMPKSVLELPMQGIEVRVSGIGVQGEGRTVHIRPLSPSDLAASTLRTWKKQGVPKGVLQVATQNVSAGESLPGNGGTHSATLLPGQLGSGELKEGMKPNERFGVVDTPKVDWIVLGIESSCDDTAAAVVRGDGTVLAHRIASQTGLHEQYGGVKPDVARQAHAGAIQSVVEGCLEDAGVAPEKLTAVAATVGPGLSLCLQVGVRHGLTIAATHRLPFVPIHHMEAHSLITRMPGIIPRPMSFPALLLLVSGGHNMLVLCQGVGQYRVVGTTLDDSVGECFDKVARLLGITNIPGGPKLEELALKGDPKVYKQRVPVPMQQGIYKSTCNFSFSGIKTSIARLVEEERARVGPSVVSEQTPQKTPGSAEPPSASEEANEGTGMGLKRKQEPAEGSVRGSFPNVGTAPSSSGTGGVTEAVLGAEKSPLRESAGVQANGIEASGTTTSTASQGLQGSGGTPPKAGGEAEASTCSWDVVRANIAATFQAVSVRFLKQRTCRALEWMASDSTQHGVPKVTCLVVAGGVAANKAVRTAMEEVSEKFGVPCVYPPIKYCTDNGLMVAWTGIERLSLGLYQKPPPLSAVEENVEVLPRWPIGPLDPRSTVKGGVSSKMYH